MLPRTFLTVLLLFPLFTILCNAALPTDPIDHSIWTLAPGISLQNNFGVFERRFSLAPGTLRGNVLFPAGIQPWILPHLRHPQARFHELSRTGNSKVYATAWGLEREHEGQPYLEKYFLFFRVHRTQGAQLIGYADSPGDLWERLRTEGKTRDEMIDEWGRHIFPPN